MNFHDILENLFGRKRKHLKRSAAYRPMLETLEHRLAPATFTVLNTADTGAGSLRQAILDANATPDPDTIVFAPALVAQTIPLTGDGLVITQPLSIVGTGQTINGNHVVDDAIFAIDDGNGGTSFAVSISGVTLTLAFNGAIANSETLTVTNSTLSGNFSNNDGAGIFNAGTLTVTNSILTGNSVLLDNDGGGIFNAGTLTVANSTFAGNSAGDNGGGIYNTGTLVVANSTFAENSAEAGHGGGISNFGTLTVTDSTLSGNSAGGNGGAIWNSATLTVTNSTLSGNSAGLDGGAIWNSATLTVTNSTLSGNSAVNEGGGIYNHDETVTVRNSTIVNNRADAEANGFGTGGGIFTVDDDATFTTVFNTIVAGNLSDVTIDDCAGKNFEAESAFNFISDPASAGGLIHNDLGNIVGDGLGAYFPVEQVLDTVLRNNGGPTQTHALIPGSLAIDAGDNASALDPGPDGVPGGGDDFPLPFDQRGQGYPRIVNTTVDIGAYEMPSALFTDDFNRATLGPNWAVKSGSPMITADMVNNAGASKVNIATVKGLAVADADLGAAVNLQVEQEAGLVARHTGPGNANYYAATLSMDMLGSVTARILRNVAGVNTILAAVQDVATGTGTLRFRLIGSQLHLFLNNDLLASVTDTRFTHGEFGFFTSNGTALDDFAAFPISTGADFTDLFTQPDGPALSEAWTPFKGQFESFNNRLRGFLSNNLAVLNGVNAADVDLRVSVNLANSISAGLIARQAGQSYYFAQLRRNSTGFIAQIILNLNGVVTVLGTATIKSTSAQANLRFRVTGRNLQLFVNDALVLNRFHGSLKTGSVGIQAGANSQLDTFIARTVRTALPFADDFNQPDGLALNGNWTHTSGNFQTLGNEAVGTAPVNLATLVGVNEMHVAVQATVTLTAAGQRVGLLAAQSGSSFYMAEVIKTATGFRLALVRNVNGVLTTLKSLTVENVPAPLTLILKLEVLGANLRLLVNDFEELSVSDRSLKSGSVGIRTVGAATINDFTATKLDFLPFTDNFDATTLNPNWAIGSGGYRTTTVFQDQASGTTGLNLMTLARLDAADVEVQAYININASTNHHAFLIARYSSSTTYYYAQFAVTNAGVEVSIRKLVGGSTTTLASTIVGRPDGTLRFRVVGNELTLFFDDVEQLSVTDFSLKTGSAGIRSSQRPIFDNFSVTAAS